MRSRRNALHFWEDFFPPISMWKWPFLAPTPLPSQCELWMWEETEQAAWINLAAFVRERKRKEYREYILRNDVDDSEIAEMVKPRGRFASPPRNSRYRIRSVI